jgi:hypothetical protein
MLNAATLTYLAALITSILTLLYFILRASGRRAGTLLGAPRIVTKMLIIPGTIDGKVQNTIPICENGWMPSISINNIPCPTS